MMYALNFYVLYSYNTCYNKLYLNKMGNFLLNQVKTLNAYYLSGLSYWAVEQPRFNEKGSQK